MNRRNFLSQISATIPALGAGSLLAPSLGFAEEAPRFTLGLSQYSLRALFKSGELAAIDFPAYAANEFGIKAIDLWEGGLPQDKLDSQAYYEEMRAKCDDLGTDLFLFMAMPMQVAPAAYEASLAKIEKSLDRASMVGARFLRIFLRVPNASEEEAIQMCVDGLKPLCDKAAAKNIVIAIEPGSSEWTKKGAFLAKVHKALNHPACGLMPDFGKLENNSYEGTVAMLPYSVSISAKMHSFDEDGNQRDFDYPKIMKAIHESDFKGIIAIEWEGKKLEPNPGVKASAELIRKTLPAGAI